MLDLIVGVAGVDFAGEDGVDVEGGALLRYCILHCNKGSFLFG